MSERVLNTHSKGERVKIPLLPKQSKIKGARQRQWSRQFVNPAFFILTTEESLVNKIDLQALYLSRTSCHKTGTRPLSCTSPRQMTKYVWSRYVHAKLSIQLIFDHHNFVLGEDLAYIPGLSNHNFKLCCCIKTHKKL